LTTDPKVPPLPPHIRVQQAKKMAQALRRGEPATRDIVRQSIRGKLSELLTR
jgi:pyruvate dehydrogenase (quinone)